MSSQISEDKFPIFDSPTKSDVEWAKVFNPGIRNGRRLICDSLLWEVCRDWLNGCRTEFSVKNATLFDGTQ